MKCKCKIFKESNLIKLQGMVNEFIECHVEYIYVMQYQYVESVSLEQDEIYSICLLYVPSKK